MAGNDSKQLAVAIGEPIGLTADARPKKEIAQGILAPWGPKTRYCFERPWPYQTMPRSASPTCTFGNERQRRISWRRIAAGQEMRSCAAAVARYAAIDALGSDRSGPPR
jgi:hypothetical protein